LHGLKMFFNKNHDIPNRSDPDSICYSGGQFKPTPLVVVQRYQG